MFIGFVMVGQVNEIEKVYSFVKNIEKLLGLLDQKSQGSIYQHSKSNLPNITWNSSFNGAEEKFKSTRKEVSASLPVITVVKS